MSIRNDYIVIYIGSSIQIKGQFTTENTDDSEEVFLVSNSTENDFPMLQGAKRDKMKPRDGKRNFLF